MFKRFKEWLKKKHIIHEIYKRPFFHERELWFAFLGINVGFEQDGKGDEFLRPIVIIRKFNNEIFWGIPTTSKPKQGKYYFTFTYNRDDSTTAILSQLRLIDSKRLKYKIGHINTNDFLELKKRIISLLK